MLVNPPTRAYKRPVPRIIKRLVGEVAESSWSSLALPVGLLQVAACVRDMCDLRLLDCRAYSPEKVRSDDGAYTTLGTPETLIRDAFREYRPDVVGIGGQFAPQEPETLRIARLVRQELPHAKTVVGGANAAVRSQALIERKEIDFCVIGEGERTFRELLDCFIRGEEPAGLSGVVSKADTELRPRPYIDDLDALPMPAYDLADEKYYRDGTRASWTKPWRYISASAYIGRMPVITSRGCPFSCTFCSIHLHMGKKFRSNSAAYVIEHLRHCVEKLGVRRFSFEDDNISFKKDRWNQLLDAIIESELDIDWITRNGIRADTLDKEVLAKMKKAGCSQLTYAVESGNPRVVNEVIKKKTSLEKISEVMACTRELGIPMEAFYVVGFPGETLDEMNDTVNFAIEHFARFGTYPILYFATPLVGTKLFEECVKLGLIVDEMISPRDWALATNYFGKRLIKTDDFSEHDLFNLERNFLERLAEQSIRKTLGRWNVFGFPGHLMEKYFAHRLRVEMKMDIDSPRGGDGDGSTAGKDLAAT